MRKSRDPIPALEEYQTSFTLGLRPLLGAALSPIGLGALPEGLLIALVTVPFCFYSNEIRWCLAKSKNMLAWFSFTFAGLTTSMVAHVYLGVTMATPIILAVFSLIWLLVFMAMGLDEVSRSFAEHERQKDIERKQDSRRIEPYV